MSSFIGSNSKNNDLNRSALLLTPLAFKREIDQVVNDARLMQGYKDAKKGDQTVNKERLGEFQ